MSPKYDPDTSHWEDDESEGPPAWVEDTSAKQITFDVQLHDQGYQTDRRWTVHCTQESDGSDIIAGYAVEHTNKGNFWRDGQLWDDAVDFIDLPRPVRKRVAAVLNRDLDAITPDERAIHREDGFGMADRDRDDDGARPDGGIIVAGLQHVCRVCGRSLTIHVAATPDEHGRPRPPTTDEQRLATARCEDCGVERVHVRVAALSGGDGS